MAKIIQEIELEVAKPNLFQAIVAKQNDYNSRFLKVAFVNNGEKINIDATLTATINAERPDGASKRFDAVVNDDGTVTAPLTGWMLELQGFVSCDISVITADGKLTTTDFSINVNEAACCDADISNDEDYDVLKDLIIKVETLEENLDLSDYVKNTQFADKDGNAGIVKVRESYGLRMLKYNDNSAERDTICIRPATETEILAKANNCAPIVPQTLDYAVKMALTDSKIEWTEAEKKAVRILLGVATDEDLGFVLKEVRLGEGIEFNHIFQKGDKYRLTWDARNSQYGGYLAKDVELIVSDIVCWEDVATHIGLAFSMPFYIDNSINWQLEIRNIVDGKATCKLYAKNDFSTWLETCDQDSLITLIKVNE
jgi:hypothetical protein